MKIKYLYKLKKNEAGKYVLRLSVGKGSSLREIEIEADDVLEKQITQGLKTPTFLDELHAGFYVYKDYLLQIKNSERLDEEEILRVKHFVLKKEKELDKIQKEIEAYENFDKIQGTKREKIPDSVRLFVWQRDGGKCAKCGKNEKLEFDHIIPIAEGGSNTERNIQLLCENCNRSKGKNI